MSENTFEIVFQGEHLTAVFLKAFLEDAGLRVYFENDLMSTIAPFQLSAGGLNPALLKVVKDDAQKALELIEDYNNMQEEE